MNVRIYHLFFSGLLTFITPISFAEMGDDLPATMIDVEQELYLDVILNQSPQSDMGHFLQQDQQLYIDATSLDNFSINSMAAPIQVGQTSYIALNQITGLRYQYDEASQKISIQVPIELLNRHHRYGYNSQPAAQINKEQEKIGVLLNYNFFAQQNEDAFSLSGWNELRAFGLYGGAFSVSGNYQYQDQKIIDSQILDTYWEKDFPEKMLRFRIGDGQSDVLSWTRSSRMSGLSLSKNFNLQPYTITTPLMDFKGQVALPSQVDLIINGIQQSSQNVVPGQFEIQSVPSITGAGQAQMVITDINGQQQVMNFALYRANNLLAEGFNDWSFNIGYPKLDYGMSSFRYGHDPAFSGNLRYGISNTWTLETHSEITNGLQQAGLGTVYQLGKQAGVINLSYAYSYTPEQNGRLLGFGYNWNSSLFSLNYNGIRQFGEFNDIASLNDSEFVQKSDQFYVGINTKAGQFGGSYIQQDYADQQSKYALFNWSYLLPRRMNLNFSYSRDLIKKENTYYLALNLPWEKRNSATATLQRSPANNQQTINVVHALDQDQGGLGWQVLANHTDQYSLLQGQVDYLGRYGQVQLNVQHNQSDYQDNTNVYASANGGLVMLKDAFLPTRLSSGSFAIVSTDDIPDVPIRLENRLIGRTNQQGYLLLNHLNPYQNNSVAIDTLDLPIDLKIETTQQNAVPRQSNGLFVRFPIYSVKSVQMYAVDADGNDLAIGQNVWDSKADLEQGKKPKTIVAHEGIIYLDDVQTDTLFIGDNQHQCQIKLPNTSNLKGFTDLGRVICR